MITYTFDDILNMNDGNNRIVYQEIKTSILSRRNVIPFIGAGMSIPPYFGWGDTLKRILLGPDFSTKITHSINKLPNDSKEHLEQLNIKLKEEHTGLNCEEYIHYLDDNIKKEEGLVLQILLNAGLYEEAADYVKKELGENQFQFYFESIFDNKDNEEVFYSKISEGMKLVAKIFDYTPIITTNYDKCIECVYNKEKNPFQNIISPDANIEQSSFFDECIENVNLKRSRYLFKIHGSYGFHAGRVLFSNEYDLKYPEDKKSSRKKYKYKYLLTELFKSNTIIFLGCSLGNDRYLKVRDEALSNMISKRDFAFLPLPTGEKEPDKKRQRELTSHHIFPLWYPNDDRAHSALITILKHLNKDIKENSEFPIMSIKNLNLCDLNMNSFYFSKRECISKIRKEFFLDLKDAEIVFNSNVNSGILLCDKKTGKFYFKE